MTKQTSKTSDLWQRFVKQHMIRLTALFLLTVFLFSSCTGEAETDTDETETAGSETSYTETEELKTPELSSINYYEIKALMPEGVTPNQSWDAMGIDDEGRVYFGVTSMRSDGLEDFVLFMFEPTGKELSYIGSFMEASKEAGNLLDGESIPKGHTKFYLYKNKLYMASQSFHDFKEQLYGLEDMRGAHLYCYDIAAGKLSDISAQLPGGVVCDFEGIVAINLMEERGLLVCLTHPYSNLIFYNIEDQKIEREVEGIPWSLGNPLSREIIISGDLIYTYRGVEEDRYSDSQFPVYVYDYMAETFTETEYMVSGGFWNGQATDKRNAFTYISTCCGELYRLDRATGEFTYLTSLDTVGNISWTYSLTFSYDERFIYYIPTNYEGGGLCCYDIAEGKCSLIKELPSAVYTGSGIRNTLNGLYYFVVFGEDGSWGGGVKLVELDIVS